MALTFILNDENKVNSYGFRTLNAGILLDRFKDNPVMLAQHENSVYSVIGRWLNIRIEGSLLMADADFDVEDTEVKKIAGKVKRGYIKACSMGLLFLPENMERDPDGVWNLRKSELLENSIVAIPSNGKCLRLYAAPGELLDETAIQLSISELTVKLSNQNTIEMEKYNLSATALTVIGLQSADNAEAVSAAIITLSQKLKEEQDAHLVTKTLMADTVKTQATTLVESAILSGKITADEKEEMITSAIQNLAFTTKMLEKLPAKTTLGGQINNTSAPEIKTADEFAKLTLTAQLAFKNDNPEGYAALFTK